MLKYRIHLNICLLVAHYSDGQTNYVTRSIIRIADILVCSSDLKLNTRDSFKDRTYFYHFNTRQVHNLDIPLYLVSKFKTSTYSSFICFNDQLIVFKKNCLHEKAVNQGQSLSRIVVTMEVFFEEGQSQQRQILLCVILKLTSLIVNEMLGLRFTKVFSSIRAFHYVQ